MTPISLSEYLSTSYRPDVDYVDGEIKERNWGEGPHSRTQTLTIFSLFQRRVQAGIVVLPELRVQVSATRVRIPDVCVVLRSAPVEPVVRHPPFLCVEILSKEDQASEFNDRIADYFHMGVRFVWVIDPLQRRAFVYTPGQMDEVSDGVLRTHDPEIAVPLEELLEPDELEGEPACRQSR
ncbi:MAG: Uma2 family endonuclease [Bryobacteraceae bacterium]